jgi:hypothetical protein
MTGNVAQVFLSDEEWAETLAHIRSVLRPDGLFIFETRIPSRRGWEEWTPDLTRRTTNIPNVGSVEYSVRLLTSDSTLRFRELHELKDSLERAGFHIQEVRDAPDRPGREYVIIAQTTP